MELAHIVNSVVTEFIAVDSIDNVKDFYPDDVFVENNGNIHLGDIYDNGVFTTLAGQPNTAPGKITRLAFLNRFTDEEAIRIDSASQGLSAEAALFRRFQKKIDAAAFIDLNDPATAMGVHTLEAVGMISPGRSAEILSMVVTPLEMYRGVE